MEWVLTFVQRNLYASSVSTRQCLHIAVAIFQTLDDQGHVALFEGIKHIAAIAFDAKDAFEAHVLEMMRQ